MSSVSCLQVLKCQQAASGDTTKLLIQLQDGMQVEAVVMHYDTTGAIDSSYSLYLTRCILQAFCRTSLADAA
jgi:adenine C2-methylase RlmN of 23S rRNA A2503 and tRNA A37